MASAASMWCVCARGTAGAIAAIVLLTTPLHAQTAQRPSAVAYDAAGNLYFADATRNQVFELEISGALTLFAGDGVQGFGGDTGQATAAELNGPEGIAVGADGSVYIADTGNERVRVVAHGVISTIAGSGSAGFAGDNGPATSAMLSRPTALAVDAQNALLVCDTNNNRVRRIAAGVISTIAGDGIQGFAGDHGAAVSAELNAPAGVAVNADGSILIADTGNQRVRRIGTDGTIATVAGTGTAGFSGDNGAAASAQISFPRGMAVDAAGNVFFADAGNQRIRYIDGQQVMHSLGGNGTQGYARDGAAAVGSALDAPLAVSANGFGAVAFADESSSPLQQIAANGMVYTLTPVAGTRTSSVVTSNVASATYGQGSLNVMVSGEAAMPQGTIELLDGTMLVATSTLTNGSVTFSLANLSAGAHQLSAAYEGDGLNPAAASAVSSLQVVPAGVTAVADAARMIYGEAVPPLTGTLTGVLPQDASSVAVSFQTTATNLSPAGIYAISAVLSGDASGNYTVAMGPGSGQLQISQAQSSVTMQPLAAQSYVGLPVLLTANVASLTSGAPTGDVSFYDGATKIASVAVSRGAAATSYVPSSAGSQSFSAVYSGDTNFLGSTSSVMTTAISAVPDFAVAASASSETVQGGLIASVPLTVSPVGGVFTGSVTLSVSGLQPGASASFSPSIVVPGSSGAAVMLRVQTVALTAGQGQRTLVLALLLPMVFWPLWTRRRRRNMVAVFLASCALVAFSGCGARTVASDGVASQNYPLTVTATSTNLVGATVSHAVAVNLIVQ